MNYNGEQNEQTIDLKDLLICILRKWRTILIVMLASAILISIYKGVLNPDLITLTTTEKSKISKQIETNNKSISSYKSSIQNNDKKMAENTKVIEGYQADLELQKTLITNLENIISKYDNGNAQSIEILTNANIQLVSIKKKVYDYQSEIEALQSENDSLPQSNESLQTKIDKLTKDNKALNVSLSPQPSKVSIGMILKYAMLGAVLGTFIVCGIVSLRYILNKKLRNACELSEIYNIRVLGNLYVVPKGNKLNVFDRLLDKWSGYTDTIDAEKQYKLISSIIQVILEGKSEQIVLTGTVDQASINQVVEKLEEVLPNDAYTLCALENPLHDADALLEIKENTVILVEAQDISDKPEISKLLDLLYVGKAKILGAVVL